MPGRRCGNWKLETENSQLIRALGRWDLVGLTINTTVGAGILGLPGRVYAQVGVYSVLSCLAGGLLMGLVAASYAEAASRFQGTGGSYLYVGAAFGRAAGFTAGWLAVATRVLAFASICNLAIGYAAGIAPSLAEPIWRVVAISAVSWGLGLVIYRGVGLSAKVNGAFTIAKLGLLGGFVLAGAAVLGTRPLPPLPPAPPVAHWAPSVVLLLFGLIGIDATVVNGAEMRAPGRDVPFGLFVGMLVVVVLYSGILLVCAGVVPDLSASTRPIFDGMVAMFGPAAGGAVACAAVLVMMGTLFTILFIGPRLLFAMAEAGQLPRFLAAVNPRFGTPGAAVLLHTGLAWALAVGSSFLGALTASTLTRLMIYGLTTASVIAMRRRGVTEQPRPLLLPGGLFAAIIATLLCAWLALQSDRAAWVSALWVLALGAALAAAPALRSKPKRT